MELDLTKLLIMASVAFYQITQPKVSFLMVLIPVQVLEKLKGNSRTTKNALGVSITSRRKQREKIWMPKLRTVYLYGLNDCIGDEYKKSGYSFACG